MKTAKRLVFAFILVLGAVLLFGNKQVSAETSGQISVEIHAVVEGTEGTALFNEDVDYGQAFNVDASTHEDDVFAFWVVNGVVDTQGVEATFVATNDFTAYAVFTKAANKAVVFIDSNGKLIETEFVADVEEATPPTELPNKIGFDHGGWTTVVHNGHELRTLQYVRNDESVITINGVEYGYNDVVTLTLPAEHTHWLDEEENVVSYKSEFKLSALENRTLTPATGGTPTDLVTLRTLNEYRSGHTTFLGQVDLLEGSELVEFGLEVDGVLRPTPIINPETNEILISIPGTTPEGAVVRAYAVVRQESELVTVFDRELETLPTISEVLAEDDGANVTFRGVVSGFTSYNSQFSNYDKVWVEDETGAITIYRGAFPTDLKVGDLYEISGKFTVYYSGLRQIDAGSSLTLLSEDNDLILSTNLNDLSVLDIPNQGTRVNISDAEVVSISSSGQELLVKLGTDQILVRSNSSSSSDAINQHLLMAVVGQKVNLHNIHVDWHNGVQLLPTKINQVEFVEPTDEELLLLAITEYLSEHDNKSFNMGTAFNLPLTGLHGSTIEWNLNANIIDGTFVDVEEDTTFILTGQMILGEAEQEISLSLTIKYVDPDGPNLVEKVIYETGFETGFNTGTTYNNTTAAKQGPIGEQWATIHGTVTTTDKINGSNSLQMRTYSGNQLGQTVTDFALNDVSKVTFNAKNDNINIGMTVSISKNGGTSWEGIETYTLSTTATNYTYYVPNDLKGGEFRIKFAITVSSGTTTRRLTIDDIVVYGFVEELTDQQKVQEAKDNLEIIYSTGDNQLSVTKDLELIELGLHEAQISWLSSNASVITNDGVVTRPEQGESDVEVTLTATISLGSVTNTKEFVVTILAKGEEPSTPETATASYPNGSGTKNMSGSGTNNAAIIGLDETVFTILSTTSGQNHVGLNNAGEIRLYGSSNYTVLTIKISDLFVITDIKFIFGGTVNNYEIKDEATSLYKGADKTNKEYSGLSSSQISIENTGSGQTYILSIEITYIPKP